MTARDTGVDVVMIGGGIGGLSNAVALGQAGFRVRVLDQAPELGEVGAGLQIAPNGTRILRSWGLLDEVIGLGVQPAGWSLGTLFLVGIATVLAVGTRRDVCRSSPAPSIHRLVGRSAQPVGSAGRLSRSAMMCSAIG